MGYFLLVVWIDDPLLPGEKAGRESIDFYILGSPTFIHAMYLYESFREDPPDFLLRKNFGYMEIRQIGDWSKAYPPIEEVPIISFNAERFRARMLKLFRDDGAEDPEAEFEEAFGPYLQDEMDDDDEF